MESLLDAAVRELAEWISRWTSPRSVLARAGAGISRTRLVSPLPVDRRPADGPGRHRDSMVRVVRLKKGLTDVAIRVAARARAIVETTLRGQGVVAASDAAKCTDKQYCWIHGNPCACCGGSDSKCPSGTEAGATWYYCCSNRRISFRDCCGNVKCPSNCPWCDNSSQPNWCGGKGGDVYVCTLAEDMGSC